MSLANLPADEIESFKKNPVGFLTIPANYTKVFGRSEAAVRDEAAKAAHYFSQPRETFSYTIEETK